MCQVNFEGVSCAFVCYVVSTVCISATLISHDSILLTILTGGIIDCRIKLCEPLQNATKCRGDFRYSFGLDG
jgi:hypothetical protein